MERCYQCNIREGTSVIATVGGTFTTGLGPVDVSVPNLCNGTAYNLYWSAGGSYPTEVGIQLIDPFGTSLYIKPPGTGSALTQLYAFSASCTPPTCAPVSGLSGRQHRCHLGFGELDVRFLLG